MNYPNSKETENAVRRWHEALQTLDEVHKQIANALPLDLLMKRDEAEAEVATRREICRVAVELHGGYKGDEGECRIEEQLEPTVSLKIIRAFILK